MSSDSVTDIEENKYIIIITGIAAGLSFIGTSFNLFMFAKYKHLRTFTYKIIMMLNFSGWLLSISAIIYLITIIIAYETLYLCLIRVSLQIFS